MKTSIYKSKLLERGVFALLLLLLHGTAYSQEEEQPTVTTKKPVKNTFESVWIIDNQTVMVPIKKTFEMDIMHRFGTLNNGYKDFFGMFAPSNIRLGFNYTPANNLMIGTAITKSNMTWEGYAKYAILKQTREKGYPVSITYYGNVAVETRNKEYYRHFSDRLLFFNQLLIARKISNQFSLQVAPSHTHVNVVDGYFSSPGKVSGAMNHNHFAVAVSGRFKIKETMALLANYDQPLTKHKSNNPNPNLSVGIELTTSAHAFQLFIGNYYFMTPQRNNYFNSNNYEDKQFLIGFNITRLWNY